MAVIENGKIKQVDKFYALYKIQWKGGHGSEVRKVFKDYIRAGIKFDISKVADEGAIYTDKETVKGKEWSANHYTKEAEKERRAAYVEYHTRYLAHECDEHGNIKLSKSEQNLIGTPMEIIGTRNFEIPCYVK